MKTEETMRRRRGCRRIQMARNNGFCVRFALEVECMALLQEQIEDQQKLRLV